MKRPNCRCGHTKSAHTYRCLRCPPDYPGRSDRHEYTPMDFAPYADEIADCSCELHHEIRRAEWNSVREIRAVQELYDALVSGAHEHVVPAVSDVVPPATFRDPGPSFMRIGLGIGISNRWSGRG